MTSLNFRDILECKKHAGPLSEAQIQYWVSRVVAGDLPDYQSAALLMAIRIQGMNFDETLALTRAMTDTGERLSFSGYPVLADKHSTGGVGDKVTLILAPLMAACGLPVTMLSGRGLGFSGGTLDKLEALEGVSCQHDGPSMQKMIDAFGFANSAATRAVAPADRVLYQLRDVTATVDSIPLITASILSKKLAGGASHLCLDVKCGTSAFMCDLDSARALGKSLKTIGRMGGMQIEGFISRMDEPLGHAVGNYLELLESVAYLRSCPDTPLMDLVFALGAKMMTMCGLNKTSDEARVRMRQALADGSALARLERYLLFCGGKPAALTRLLKDDFNNYERMPILADAAGYVGAIQGRAIGEMMTRINAGRAERDDQIDPIAGLYLNKQLGDSVDAGEPLGWLYGAKALSMGNSACDEVRSFFSTTASATPVAPVIVEAL